MAIEIYFLLVTLHYSIIKFRSIAILSDIHLCFEGDCEYIAIEIHMDKYHEIEIEIEIDLSPSSIQ